MGIVLLSVHSYKEFPRLCCILSIPPWKKSGLSFIRKKMQDFYKTNIYIILLWVGSCFHIFWFCTHFEKNFFTNNFFKTSTKHNLSFASEKKEYICLDFCHLQVTFLFNFTDVKDVHYLINHIIRRRSKIKCIKLSIDRIKTSDLFQQGNNLFMCSYW